MAKYTTLVRSICEVKAGLDESTGFTNVDQVLNGSWNKIFTTQCEFFDEDYRSILCKKILKHYYMREIGAETAGLWMLWMNTKLEEIMPFYNQLYKSELLEFNPLYDVELTRQHTTESEGNSTTNASGTNTSTAYDLYSDTPQGALTGVDSEEYLTNASKNTQNSGYNDNGNTQATNTENYLEKVFGKQGSGTFSSALNEFRTTFLNIDMRVIDEFKDLFFNLW